MCQLIASPYSEIKAQIKAIHNLLDVDDEEILHDTSVLDKLRLLFNICPDKDQKKLLKENLPVLDDLLSMETIFEHITKLEVH